MLNVFTRLSARFPRQLRSLAKACRWLPVTVAAGMSLFVARDANAACTADQRVYFLQQAQYYQNQANSICPKASQYGSSYVQLCNTYKQYAALYSAQARSCSSSGNSGSGSGSGSGTGSSSSAAQQQAQQVANAKQAALNWIARNRPGRNGGFVLYYRKPGAYAGQGFGPEMVYHMKAYEAQRVITMLTNNGNLLTRIGPW